MAARGLYQLSVGQTADPLQVTGKTATPKGNDYKIQALLNGIKPSHRKQRWGDNYVTCQIQDVASDSGGQKVYTRYIVGTVKRGSRVKSLTIHVREILGGATATEIPAVTVRMYRAKDLAMATAATDPNLRWDSTAEAEDIVPASIVYATADNSSVPTSITVDPFAGNHRFAIKNKNLEAGDVYIIKIEPPAWNSSAATGWKNAQVTLRLSEIHLT